MPAQSSALPKTINNRIDLSGLDDLFEQQFEPLLARGLSLKEAQYFYGLTKKQLKSQIKKSLIPAIQVDGGKGGKWLIYPEGVPNEFEQLAKVQAEAQAADKKEELPKPQAEPESKIKRKRKVEQEPVQAIMEFRQAFHNLPRLENASTKHEWLDFSPQINDPLDKLKKRLAESEHKNSYLETRIAALEDQVRFLTQSHYRKPSLNALAVVLPVLMLISAILAICMPSLSGS